MRIKTQHNQGIISTGAHAQNTVNHYHPVSVEEINWDRLCKEVDALKSAPDASVKQFAGEGSDAIAARDARKIQSWLTKWIPCISGLIETSYYIIEIASKFGVIK